jgi:large subunit ribosomal protein L25
MALKAQLSATARTAGRKKAAKALRAQGQVPAIIYGHGREPQSLALAAIEFDRLLETIAPESTIVEVAVGGQTTRALIREIQRHPIKQGIVHVDFQEIHAGEKLRLEIPIHLVGTPEGVRNQGGILDQVLRMIQIEVLPEHIPEHVELDVTVLVIGRSLHVSDLKIPNAQIINDPSLTVVTVAAPRAEEEVTPAAAATAVEGAEPTAVAEPEVIKKGKIEEEEPEEK